MSEWLSLLTVHNIVCGVAFVFTISAGFVECLQLLAGSDQ